MDIVFQNPFTKKQIAIKPEGLVEGETILFPYIKGSYRIVQQNNYTDNFGYQWNKFVTTQIDRASKIDISKERFFSATGWDKENLEGKNILEVGSGAGRFSQIVLDHTKANLYSIDYSNAVEANFENNGANKRLQLFQASIYDMPFVKAQFDKVFCFGVLQHTPDVKKSVASLAEMVKPGGELIVDFYPINGWWTKFHAKYLFRPFTKKMSHEKLLKKIDSNIDWLIKLYRFNSAIGIGKIVNRFLPICDIDGTLPKNITTQQLREMCVLDTFDMFSPAYDQPQRINTIIDWFKKCGMKNIWGGKIVYADNIELTIVKGIKSSS